MSAGAETRGAARELTPAGAGGVAVVAVDGADARARLAALVGGALPAPGTVRLARLVRGRGTAGAELVDEALIVARPGGALEAHVHGGRATVAAVRAALASDGHADARDARPSLEERLVDVAARAPTSLGAALALAQAEGGRLRAALEAVLAAEPAGAARLASELVARSSPLAPLFARTAVALTGRVNAGKSTLINALAGVELALVSDEEGTTRDSVAAEVVTPTGWPLLVIDTAGARDLDGVAESGAREVERAGQELGQRVAARADVVLALVPAGAHAPAAVPRALRLWTRTAERLGPDRAPWPAAHVSALEDPEHAAATVGALVEDALGFPDLAPLRAALEAGTAWPVAVEGELTAALSAVARSPDTARLDALRGLL